MVSRYNFIDLFAGAGGLSLGLEQAGFNLIFSNEINPICANTYLKNREKNLNGYFIGDISELNKNINDYISSTENIFLVAGGPPCQGFSMANRQRLIDDPRNRLYLEYLNFLKKIKPSFFIMENVKGMLNKIEEIIDNFNLILNHEYDISFSLLNAKDYSVPQSRERLFIIGNKIGIKSEKVFKTLESFPQINYNLRNAIEDLPILMPNTIKNNTKRENDSIGYFEKIYEYQKTDFYNFINEKRVIDKLYNHKNRYNNNRDIEIYSRLPQGANSLHECIKDIMPYNRRNHVFKDKYYKLVYDLPCKTITSHMKNDCNMYIHPTQSRGLSPREAARIQTFPDDYVFYGPQNSWYLQIGNAVPVKLAESIGRAILQCVK